jgi:tripartite ATP-independent transporter DctM subunit
VEAQLLILVVGFVVLLALNTPVAIAIGLCTWLAVLSLGNVPANYIVAQRMSNGIASFPLLAIPFFILAGNLMGDGGMARRLVDFAAALVGGYRGGLAYVSTLTCMLFGAISGSATAAVSSVGGMMIPEMQRQGYHRAFSVAVTTTAATTGLLIPPSNVMIVFAVVAGNVSVASMFMAGILPGILVGLSIMVVCRLLASRCQDLDSYHMAVDGLSPTSLGTTACIQKDVPSTPAVSPSLFWTAVSALPSLLLVVIVLAGILGGAFSATEAAAIAVLYAFVMAVIVYREVHLRDLPGILLRTGITTSVVFLLISTSQAMSWVLAYQNIPQSLAAAMLQLSDNPYVLLLIINLILLAVGTVMDMTPAVLIFAPIFLPVVTQLGMDPVHFGIMMIANLCIGLCTPPVGTCLFVGCSVGQTSIAAVTRPMLPFIVAMLVSLLLITYVPALSLWLPSWLVL